MRFPAPPLLVISDRHQARRPLEEVAEATFAGGCRWFSLREKDLPAAERRALLRDLIAIAAPWGATIMVHDDTAYRRRPGWSSQAGSHSSSAIRGNTAPVLVRS